MKRLLYILLPCILLAISVGCDGGATVDGPTAGSAADPTKGMDNLTPGGGMSPGIPEEAATEEAATEEAATEEAATEEAATEEPLQKKPLRKKPLQKKKLQKKPLQKKPLQKKPLQKKPLRKKPLRRKKLQKKPLQKKPLQKKKLQKKKLQNDRSCGPFSGCLSTTGPNVISPMPVRGLQNRYGLLFVLWYSVGATINWRSTLQRWNYVSRSCGDSDRVGCAVGQRPKCW